MKRLWGIFMALSVYGSSVFALGTEYDESTYQLKDYTPMILQTSTGSKVTVIVHKNEAPKLQNIQTGENLQLLYTPSY